MTTDVLFNQDDNGNYDLVISDEGDITLIDAFDTSLLYSIFGEKRALPAEVPISSNRRGWIGNQFSTFENGSKLWLYEQERLTRTVLNSIEKEAINALTWLVDDGIALNSIKAVATVTRNNGVGLLITIERPNSKVDTIFFQLWDNTGISHA